MTLNPKVSIIIPVYNKEKHLEQCLSSVIKQTLENIEIICIDDGSSDNSLEILKKYSKKDNRIRVFSQKNKGAGAARNYGIECATGEYITFLDSDDWVESSICELAFEKAVKTSADVIICLSDNYIENSNKFEPRPYSLKLGMLNKMEIFSKEDIKQNVFNFTTPDVWAKFFNRQFIRENNIHFQNLKSCNDVSFCLHSLALAKKITYVNNVLLHWRVNTQNSITSTRYKHTENWILSFNYIKKVLKQNGLWENLSQATYTSYLNTFKYELNYCRNVYLLKLIYNMFKYFEREDLCYIAKKIFLRLYRTLRIYYYY